MPRQKSKAVVFTPEMTKQVEAYLEANSICFNQFARLAVEAYLLSQQKEAEETLRKPQPTKKSTSYTKGF